MKFTKIPLIVGVFITLTFTAIVQAASLGNTVAAVDVAGTSIKYKAGNFTNCSDADGWTTGSDLEAALAAMGSSATLSICAGTYSGTMLDATDGVDIVANGQAIEGTGTVIIDGSGISDHVIINPSFTGFSLKNITNVISKNGFYSVNLNNGGTVTNVGMSGGRCLYTDQTCVVKNSTCFDTADSTGYPHRQSAATGSTTITNFSYKGKHYNPVYVTNGAVTYNQSLFMGFNNTGDGTQVALANGSTTGTVTLNNCIFAANGLTWTTSDHVIINGGASNPVVANNCILLPSPNTPDTYYWANVTETGSVYKDPLFRLLRRPAYVSFMVDDFDNFDTSFASMAAYLKSKGLTGASFAASYLPPTGTWTQGRSPYTDTQIQSMANYITDGFEIAGHCSSATSDVTNLNAITIVGPANSTVDITTDQSNSNPDNWTGTLDAKVSGTSVGGVFPINFASSTYNGLNMVKAAIDALGGGWSATVHASAGAISNPLTLKAASGQAVAGAGYLFTFENNLVGSSPVERFWYYEIVYHKKKIEDAITAKLGSAYTLKTFVYPAGVFSADLKTFLSTASNFTALSATLTPYKQARGATNGGGSWTLSDDFQSGTGAKYGIQNWEITGPTLAYVGATNIERNVAAWSEWLGYIGGFACFYMHGFTTPSEANMKLIIDYFAQNPNVSIKTIGAHSDYIMTSGLWADADSDGTRWTRTFTDASDYRLRAGSPALDAGIAVAGIHTSGSNVITGGDLVGNTKLYGKGIDIGPYERKKYLFDDDDMIPKTYKVP